MNPEFEALLDYIKRNRGFDFTGYKRSTLMRRVEKRLQIVKIESYIDYMDYLEVHPQEFILLFNTILINVTTFFRDSSTWDYLANEIIPRLLAAKQPHEPIRIWSAACSSGEEAYTIAMILANALGVEQFRDRVKIYGTDLDEEAIKQARSAIYNTKQMADVPEDLRSQYFHIFNNNYTFDKELRRSVIFGRHNLVTDAPISRIDLLVCRNALMYFNAEAQAKILARFYFALRDRGFLFLGKAEMLLSYSNSFTPVDLKRRIFTKVSKVNTRSSLMFMDHNSDDEESNHLNIDDSIREAAFDVSPMAQVVLDLNGNLILANERARMLLTLSPKNLGSPLQKLQFYRRSVELGSSIQQVYADLRSINLKDIEFIIPSGDILDFDVQIEPLFDQSSNPVGINIIFIDVTRSKRLQHELEQSNQELEMAYEELQSTNEELETTNEELQSSNEELETTNEELQSTNEELETMNEELQSSNEELQTMNDELRLRSQEFNQANAFLESILISMRGGVVVVNLTLHIQVWNNKAEDLWGLRATEVQGQHFLNLDIGLPVEQLAQPIRTCLLGQTQYLQVTLNAINRRGKAIQCQVSLTPLTGTGKEIEGVIILMEEQE